MSELPAVLRRTTVPPQVHDWIHRGTGSRVVSVRRLPGASSTAVHLVLLADGATLVLRRYSWATFLDEEPDAPRREVEALGYAGRHQLPAPAVVAADTSGGEVGDGVPVVLMTRVPGRAQPSPDVGPLATLAWSVHEISGDGFGHRYFPWCRETATAPPRSCRRPADWERALELWRSAEPPYEPRFVHRDSHPGNVVWSRRRIGGVVDWANACTGPPGIDVATCRWNLHDWAGAHAADAFVRVYEQRSGHAHHPYWDVAKIVENDWNLIDDPARVAQAENLLAQALPRLLAVV